jgi:multiple sugar transport system ATP-binding protein
LSNLDAKLRVQTRGQIAQLQRRLGTTTVYVTHDQVEAMTLGDRVAVMRDGVLQQCDTPRRAYHNPVNVFVAGFLGSPAMNLIETPTTEMGAAFGDVVVPIPRSTLNGATAVILGVRPEDLKVSAPGNGGVSVVVDVVEELGSEAFLYGRTEIGGKETAIIARVADWRHPPGAGETVTVTADPARTHTFSVETGERLVS